MCFLTQITFIIDEKIELSVNQHHMPFSMNNEQHTVLSIIRNYLLLESRFSQIIFPSGPL